MAGDESSAGNPLLVDFILIGRRLERLGFSYYKNRVVILCSTKTQ